MTATRTTRKTKAPKVQDRRLSYDARQGLLTITIDGQEFNYWLERWQHVSRPMHAFRLTKLRKPDAEPESYDVTFHEDSGTKGCGCMGFLRWNHCKHSDAVAVLVSRKLA